MNKTNSNITLTSFGAAGEVTGSKHLLETPQGSRILLDCGLFQGRRQEAARKNCSFGFNPGSIDAVVLSHAHIDHSGLLPKLAKEGFKGPIYATEGTCELADPMLRDSGHIQEEDEEFIKRHRIKTSLDCQLPIYTEEDAVAVLKQFVGKPYYDQFDVTDDVRVEFLDAGHVFGSAIVVVTIQVPDGERRLVFTGDLGRSDLPILRDPMSVKKADYLMIESTYGDRSHNRVKEVEDDLAAVITKTAKRGGKVFIPCFALERTQEIILRIEELIATKRIPNLKIYLDSPLAIRLTKVFQKYPEYYDEATAQLYKKKRHVFSFPNLEYTESVDESKALNSIHVPSIIIAGSGMAESGRIRHHLKNNIEDPKHSVLMVGYQAEETLGRKLVDGYKVVSMFNQNYHVRAEIFVFRSLSAHADQHDLDQYVEGIKGLKKIILVHGEEISRKAFAERIRSIRPEADIILPIMGQTNILE
jgi:metallo-beta-lactamase family protein